MRFRGKYQFLSNMYECDVPMLDGNVYSCGEAAFQAQKCEDVEDRKQFCGISGYDARRLGRSVPLRSDWNNIKLSVMEDVVDGKFSNVDLADKLMNVEGVIVEDNTWGDKFWGQVDGQGENHLGKLLMQKRDDLLLENSFVPMDFVNKNGDMMHVSVYGTKGSIDDNKMYHVTWDEQVGFKAGALDLPGSKINEIKVVQNVRDTSSISVASGLGDIAGDRELS